MPRQLGRADTVDEDRAAIVALVRRSGNFRLRQDVYDVRSALNEAGCAVLRYPTELGRRLTELAAQERPVLTRVDGALEYVLDLPRRKQETTRETPRRRGGSSGPRVTAQYVLTSRMHELQHAREDSLDDLERVVIALAVASFKLGGAAAPTRLVTQVMHTVTALAVSSTQQRNVLLGRLAGRIEPVVREVKEYGSRASRWILDAPLRVEWMPWVQSTVKLYERELDHISGPMADVGAVSHADLVARLVQKAVASTRSTTWPDGHPLTSRELAGIVSEARIQHADPHGLVPLEDALRRVNTDIPTALQAATRGAFSDGTTSQRPGVRRIDHLLLKSPRYVDAGFSEKVASAYADLLALHIEMSRSVRARMSAEWSSCRELVTSADSAVRTIAIARGLTLRRFLDQLHTDTLTLRRRLAEVSCQHDASLQRIHDQMADLAHDWPEAEVLEVSAHEALRSTSFSLSSVLGAPRPLISAEDLTSMMPTSLTAGISPAVFAASAVTVRRPATARMGRGARVGLGRTESRRLDRVDAVLFASETAMLLE